MTTQRLDSIVADLAAINLTLQSHESVISFQWTKLDSLFYSVSELSHFVSFLCTEMCESHSSSSASPLCPPFDDNHLYSKHVELPPFSDTGPVGWLAKVETYFSVQHTPTRNAYFLCSDLYEGHDMALV